MDEDIEVEDLQSNPCPECGCDVGEDAAETMGLCWTCYGTYCNEQEEDNE